MSDGRPPLGVVAALAALVGADSPDTRVLRPVPSLPPTVRIKKHGLRGVLPRSQRVKLRAPRGGKTSAATRRRRREMAHASRKANR